MQRFQQLQKIKQLKAENRVLRAMIVLDRRLWREIAILIGKIREVLGLTEMAVESFNIHTAIAQRDWLEFWGIHEETFNSAPSNWI